MAADRHPGFFLTFEGLDGSGKTTQIRKLAAWLEAQNLPHTLTRQPGGTPTGDRIRALLLDSKSSNLAPKTELAMMFADRAQAIQEVIAPALADGQVVVCDRFTDSTEAYQGGGRQLGSEIVLELHRLICGDLQPDLTILLLPDLTQSLARARRRNTKSTGPDEGRFEAEKDAFFERTHAKYQEIAARNPFRVITIDGNLSIEEVHRHVIKAVEARLKSRIHERKNHGQRNQHRNPRASHNPHQINTCAHSFEGKIPLSARPQAQPALLSLEPLLQARQPDPAL